ncbi:MAG TPA: serine/threonine protein phosphatase [Propionibacteriaceae bacterium]|nr:serine/threonine-protein phosphatase [Micropruina sp.]HBX79873.1 serine/threonine protein phosphatase [Propionibacteriaceae bacterium]HBY23512.1 serine/threonine protein phosphatase [Propionibacteriaceae bacterium]
MNAATWENPPSDGSVADGERPRLIEWTPSPASVPLQQADAPATLPPASLKPADAVPAEPPRSGTELPSVTQPMRRPLPPPPPASDTAEPEDDLSGHPSVCATCGGAVDADGYCTQCGAKAAPYRDHFEESPTTWVAGVSDRGIRHHRNEDALAISATDEPARAVLVVCDGVSNSEDSDTASLAAARAARGALIEAAQAATAPASQAAASLATAIRAASIANDAVIANTRPDSVNSAACTYTAVVIEDDQVLVANLGDSRAYWISGKGGQMLTVDDSVAQDLIAQGTPRKMAEVAKDAHAITKWLGRDAIDVVPMTATFTVPGDGWIIACSDGLWNYASSPEELAVQVAAASAASSAPLDVARALVLWANAQGGKDNITVALARFATILPGEQASAKLADAAPPSTTTNPTEASEVR